MYRTGKSLGTCTGVSLSLALASCAAVPDLGQAPMPRKPESVESSVSLVASADAQWPQDSWWRSETDPQLIILIEEGIKNSPDLSAALARFRKASGLAQEAGAAMLPTVDVNGSAGFTKQSYNNGFPKEFLPRGWQDNGQVAAAPRFDLDIWGRNRAALAAATSEERAAALEADQAKLLLTTGIASAYIDLARLFAVRDIRQAALELRTASQRLISSRLVQGLETRGSLRQSDADVSTARIDLTEAEQAIALRRNQIAALLGAGPDRGLAITRPTLAALIQRGLPADVTTDLIGRRPDIAAARSVVEAAASRIKVSRADFFPAISLSALVGVQSLGIDRLFDSGSTFGNAGIATSLPIFRGGALRGRYRQARASYDEAVANYDRSVVSAYQEVADVVTRKRMLERRIAEARVALTASEEAFAIARLRYDGGLSSYFDVIFVEDRLLQARLTVAGLDADALALDIGLIRALGGGFAASGQIREEKLRG